MKDRVVVARRLGALGSLAFRVALPFAIGACGESFTASPGGEGGGASSTSAGSGPSSGAASSSSSSSSSSSGASTSSSSSSSTASSSGVTSSCDDVSGTFTVAIDEGGACAGISASAMECITQTGCTIVFRSTPAMSGVDGQATLIGDDAFTGAELAWGGTKHSSGGTWDNSKKVYTVSFDVLDVTQGCVVKLTRTGDCK